MDTEEVASRSDPTMLAAVTEAGDNHRSRARAATAHDSEKSADLLEPRLFISTSIAYAAVATEEESIARAKERT